MARLHNDLFNMSWALFKALPDNFKIYVSAAAVTTVFASSSSVANKAVRWITRDSTNYVAWNDLQGQIDRLATERFEELRGALAPAAIYDRRNFIGKAKDSFVAGLSNLKDRGIYVLSSAAVLMVAGYWLNDCHQNYPTDQHWNHLGLALKDPAFLTALATAYTVIYAGTPIFYLGSRVGLGTLNLLSSGGDGFRSRIVPTALTNKITLLQDRYQALSEKLKEQWTDAKKKEDPVEMKKIVQKAEQLERRILLIKFGLEEYFELDDAQSQTIINPLIQAAKTIITESNHNKINEEKTS